MSITAAELKAEEMIKMPIRLVERGNPHEAISSALAKREELERLAAEEEKTAGSISGRLFCFGRRAGRRGRSGSRRMCCVRCWSRILT